MTYYINCGFMDDTKIKIKNEILTLYGEGVKVYQYEQAKQTKMPIPKTSKGKTSETEKAVRLHEDYQLWYSKSLPVIRQLLPERYQEFQDQYKPERRSDQILDFLTYSISDYLLGIRVTRGKVNVFDPYSPFSSKFHLQLSILLSAADRVDSLLTDMEGVLQSDLFKHELLAADELFKKKHLRSAGTLTGVSLEMHLGRVCMNHNISMTKKSPTISDFNEALKSANIIDVPTWRHIQLLGDIRNLCAHAKGREPTNDEISDLISGTKKIQSTVF